jgi:CheY-like chemotaxis protein
MSKKILFADGDTAIIEAVTSMLEGLGHKVRTETSGTAALSVFSRNPGGFDLIITDIGMPDISGLLLATKFLKIRSDISIVLLAGLDGQEQSRDRETGIRWFGIKPLSMTDLACTVESALMGAD